MARGKAGPALAHGKRVPLLIVVVHGKPTGKPVPRSSARRKASAKSKR